MYSNSGVYLEKYTHMIQPCVFNTFYHTLHQTLHRSIKVGVLEIVHFAVFKELVQKHVHARRITRQKLEMVDVFDTSIQQDLVQLRLGWVHSQYNPLQRKTLWRLLPMSDPRGKHERRKPTDVEGGDRFVRRLGVDPLAELCWLLDEPIVLALVRT